MAEGTSAECAEMTPVVLESTLHETQEPHSSLPLTPRLPIEGEPSRCKQEVADSVGTAGCTNRMVETANLPETIADIDRTALLGGKPVERAHGVDEGDGTEREPQSRLQQTIFYSKEDQHNANANGDVPFANRLPLEGEWTVNPSGERDTSVHASVDEAEGDPGREVKPADVPNESDMLIVLSIESESMGDGEILRVYLRGTSWCPYNVEGLGCRTDMSKGLPDGPRGLTDVLGQLNNAEMTGLSHSDGVYTYLGVGDLKCGVKEADDARSHTDEAIGDGDVPRVEMDVDMPAKAPENIRTHRKKTKPPDLPMEAARAAPDKPDGRGNHTDRSGVHRDVHSIGNERETGANETENVRTSQNDSKAPNSPYMCEIATPKPADRWKRVSADDTYVYLPWNAPIEVLSRTFEFGQVEGADEAIVPSFECEGAGDSDGDRDGDNGGVGGTTSSGSVHLI